MKKETKKTKIKEDKSPKASVLAKKLTEEILAELKIESTFSLKEDKEGTILIQLETKDPGILIGYHGETLNSLQLILAMMVYRQTGQWKRILVNVGDYLEKRAESLERIALSAAQKAKFSSEDQYLPFMSSAERRLVHLALKDDPEIVTESEGEDYHRRVVIKLKK